jgi:hypothetical protein
MCCGYYSHKELFLVNIGRAMALIGLGLLWLTWVADKGPEAKGPLVSFKVH